MALKLDFGKLPWHAQLGTFAFLAVAGVGAFWYFYASPAQAKLVTRRAEVAKLQVQIKEGLATAKRLPEFRREVTVLEAQLDRLRAVLPEEQDVADLLRRVQAMATQSNLQIKGFTPASVTRREMHAEWLTNSGCKTTLRCCGDGVFKSLSRSQCSKSFVRTIPHCAMAAD